MSIIQVPARVPGEEWPSLGPQVVQFIEACLVFGPGDLRGQPARLDDEKKALIHVMYQVYPQGARDANGKPIDGRRRFRRCCWSAQKGSAKTEFAAWIGAAELSPEGPVRFDRWSNGRPLGRAVIDPYIPMVAYTEEQTEDLAYAALKVILEQSSIAGQFDIGIERIMRRGGDGKAVALAGSPDARDGARTTWAHKDETHRWTLPRLKKAAQTMINNLPKRLLADPWELETTTAYSPGEGSVAEDTAEYARQVGDNRIRDSRLFYFHRQASDGYDLTKPEDIRAAVMEAAGPTAGWKDIEGICEIRQDPTTDLAYWERVYLNRPVAAAAQAFNAARWQENAVSGKETPESGLITLGFDGSIYDDATALIATHVESGLQFPLGIWERPFRATEWEVPREEVDAVVDEAFRRYEVWRMYADPSKWDTMLSAWAGRYGEKVIVSWPTRLYGKMAVALKAYAGAIDAGEVKNNGDRDFARHIGNAVKTPMNFRDDDGSPLWLIQKDRPGSPNKIDAAMAGCLSWRARLDAVASGVLAESAEEAGGFFA